MRSVRILRNVVSNYLRFGISGLVGIVLTRTMVRGLGDQDYGLWVTVFSLTGYFGLFDQGIRPSLVRYVARDHALQDRNGLSRTLSSAMLLYGVVGVLAALATVVAVITCPMWLRFDPSRVDEMRTAVAIAGVTISLGFPLGIFGATLSGLQRYDLANTFGIGVLLARAVAFVVVLRLGGGLVALAWTHLVTSLVGYGLSAIAVRRVLPQLELARARVDLPHLRLIGSYSGFAFVGALATMLTFQTDALVIAWALGASLVTPFSFAAGLVESARSLVHSATFVLAPTASELETLGESQKLHAMVIAGARYSVLLSWPVLTALLVFGGNILTTWVGEKYASAWPLLVILTVPTFVTLPQSAASSVLYGVSRHRGVVLLSILNALLNLALSILWVKPFGLVGVAMGTAVPLVVVGGVAFTIYTCRALALPLWRFLRDGILVPGLTTVPYVLLALGAQALWHPIGWIALALVTGGCWVVYAALALRFGTTASERARWGRMMPGLFRWGAAPAGSGR